jgi:hypothetical protein
LKDDLAPPELSIALADQLEKKGLDLEVCRHGDCQWLLLDIEQAFLCVLLAV